MTTITFKLSEPQEFITYTTSGRQDGTITLEPNRLYTLQYLQPAADRWHKLGSGLSVANYCFDELLIRATDVLDAVKLGIVEVIDTRVR